MEIVSNDLDVFATQLLPQHKCCRTTVDYDAVTSIAQISSSGCDICFFAIMLSIVDIKGRHIFFMLSNLSAPFLTFLNLPSSSSLEMSRLAVAGETLKVSIIVLTLMECSSSSNARILLCRCTSFISVTNYFIISQVSNDYAVITIDLL